MKRTLLAFLLAPLWAPAFALVSALRTLLPLRIEVSVLGVVAAAVLGYVGAIVLGLPAYLAFRRLRWTKVWPMIGVGFVIGDIMWLGLFSMLVMALSVKPPEEVFVQRLKSLSTLAGMVLIPGAIGALVGFTLWFIARPDRRQAR
jgi:hypothetical protein